MAESANIVTFKAQSEDMRLDALISAECEITRSAAAKLIEDGCVSVAGKISTKKSLKSKEGTPVEVALPEVRLCEAVAQDIPINIVYEDEYIIIVDKPQGMVVHPAPGNPDRTLVNALMYHCKGKLSGINGVIRPGIVHRIDKDTSGLLAVAKNDIAHLNLAGQIKEHSFKRIYNAVITGRMKEDSGTINLPIGRHPVDRKKMAVTQVNSKEAITHYKVIAEYNSYSHLELKLETGRTHQIRVHMSNCGHPIVGDPIYSPMNGKNKFGLQGQCLHAKVLGITHPVSGEYMEFESALPDYFRKVLTDLSFLK